MDADRLQPAIRPMPQSRRAHGFKKYVLAQPPPTYLYFANSVQEHPTISSNLVTLDQTQKDVALGICTLVE